MDLEPTNEDCEGWEWETGAVNGYLQEFLADVLPAMSRATTIQYPQSSVSRRRMKPCFNARVTRPVTRTEMISKPKAMDAFMKEWEGLWVQGAFETRE